LSKFNRVQKAFDVDLHLILSKFNRVKKAFDEVLGAIALNLILYVFSAFQYPHPIPL